MKNRVRLGACIACVLSLIGARVTHAQVWGPFGVLVPGISGDLLQIVPDEQGGVYIGWSDGRSYTTSLDDVYAQHLTAAGTLAPGCPPTGIPICVNPLRQFFGLVAADGMGGAFIGWYDGRIPGPALTPLLSRITSSGDLMPGWLPNGTEVAPIGSAGGNTLCTADGAGGALCIWDDVRNGVSYDLYAQHLTATGTPAPAWPDTGQPIALGPWFKYVIGIAGDGAGGFYTCWDDRRPTTPGVYLQHVLGNGTLAAGWPVNGLRVATGRGPVGFAPDGSGGFYIGMGVSSHVYQADSTYYILRVDGNGQKVAGWADNGTLVCGADFVRNSPLLSADAQGHVFMSWVDYRGWGFGDVYVTELQADGTLAPGWVADGVRASVFPRYQDNWDLLADGLGGVYLAGIYNSDAGSDAFVQHFGGSGAPAPGWDSAGVRLYPQSGQYEPRLAPDGAGGAIVVWINAAALGCYAQRFPGPAPTAVQLSLVSSDAQADHVAFLWNGTGSGSLNATVERSTTTSGWVALGAAIVDGADRLRYDDRTVVPGTRYGYRLRYLDAGQSRTSAETWVDVPRPALALAGLRPNPGVAANLQVAFTLPQGAPATLELLDVAGRRVAAREVGSLGAGPHVAPLMPDARIAPGLYWLRLTQAGRALTAKAVVAR